MTTTTTLTLRNTHSVDTQGLAQAAIPQALYENILDLCERRGWLPTELSDLYQEYEALQSASPGSMTARVWLALSGLCALKIDACGDSAILTRWIAQNFSGEIFIPPWSLADLLQGVLDGSLDGIVLPPSRSLSSSGDCRQNSQSTRLKIA